MNWAIIMAGGSGTRFWPESRRDRAKQFLNIFGPQTLIQQTFDRVKKVGPASRILVFTSLGRASSTAKAEVTNVISGRVQRTRSRESGL